MAQEEFKVPEGMEKISGAEFPTKEKQEAAFTDIAQDPTGTFLYGKRIETEPEVPIYNKKEIKGQIQESLKQKDIMGKKANKAFADAILRYKEGRDAKPEEVTGTIGDIVERYDVGELAPGFGTQDDVSEQEDTIQDKPDIISQIDETYKNLTTGIGDVKAEAREEVGLEGKSEALTEAETLVNDLRTKLQKQQIGDIKEQDVIKGKPLLTSQIQGELNKLSREQKLDMMITQQDYNNALVGVQIAQGNYDRARDIVKETADDWYDAQVLKLDYLQMQKGWQDEERARYQEEINYERELRLKGFSYIQDTETYNKLVKEYNVTAETFDQFFFKDPANGKIYLRPQETEDDFLSVSEAKSLGVPYGTTRQEAMDMGITVPRYKPSGSGVTPTKTTKAGSYFTDTQLAKGASNANMSIAEFGNLSVDKANKFIYGSDDDNTEYEDAQAYVNENKDASDEELKAELMKSDLDVSEISAIIDSREKYEVYTEDWLKKTVKEMVKIGGSAEEIRDDLIDRFSIDKLKEMAKDAGYAGFFTHKKTEILNYIKSLM